MKKLLQRYMLCVLVAGAFQIKAQEAKSDIPSQKFDLETVKKQLKKNPYKGNLKNIKALLEGVESKLIAAETVKTTADEDLALGKQVNSIINTTRAIVNGLFPGISEEALEKATLMGLLLMNFDIDKFNDFPARMKLVFIEIINNLVSLNSKKAQQIKREIGFRD